MLWLEVRSLKKLDNSLHYEHKSPAMRPFIEAARRNIQGLKDELMARNEPSKREAKRKYSGRH
jgi:hypothetical protein